MLTDNSGKYLNIPDFSKTKGHESRRDSHKSARKDDAYTTKSKKIRNLSDVLKPERNLVYKAYQDYGNLYECMYFEESSNNWGSITTKIVMN